MLEITRVLGSMTIVNTLWVHGFQKSQQTSLGSEWLGPDGGLPRLGHWKGLLQCHEGWDDAIRVAGFLETFPREKPWFQQLKWWFCWMFKVVFTDLFNISIPVYNIWWNTKVIGIWMESSLIGQWTFSPMNIWGYSSWHGHTWYTLIAVVMTWGQFTSTD